MKIQYQTKFQTLLNILLEEVEEDIELSEGRITHLFKEKDWETLRIEAKINETYKLKKKHIEALIEMEKGCGSSHQSIIKIGYVNHEGDTELDDIYYAEDRVEEK